MEIKRYEGTGRMSRAVVYGDTIYLCGQTSAEQTDMAGQTKATLAKIEDLLGKYGSDKDHILSATIYVKDMTLFNEMNSVWDAWVNDGCEIGRASCRERV